MSLQYTLGILSTVALFAPVFCLALLRLYRFRVYLALFIYCILAFAYSLMTEDLINLPSRAENLYGLINNLVDVPLMMIFLLLFAKSQRQRTWMIRLTVLYLVYELAVLLIMQKLDRDTIAVTMAPGLAMVLFYSISFFIHRARVAITYQKAHGKAILISAILFAYVCFTFIYVMHYVLQIKATNDIFLLYYIVSLIYSTTLAIGLVIENRRIKKLEEVHTTRRELSEVFSKDRTERKKAVPGMETADYWRFN